MQIGRMRASIERRPAILEKVFSPEEREYLMARGDPAQSAAGLFAAKEAVLKAMGEGLGRIPLREVSFTHGARGQPLLALPVEGTMHVSITHMGDTAAAVAVWEEERER